MRVERLSGGYEDKIIIDDISFDIKRKEFLGIIGPNGSGKSTLLKLMSRVLSPKKGRVLFEDKDISKVRLKDLAKRIAFVPQETQISFSFTVEEIVLMGRIPHLSRLQLETKRDFEITEYTLQLTNSLHLKDRKIDQLSSGEKQRIIIAKALAQIPVLLFLDEPTSHLDIGYQIEILSLLKRLNIEKDLTVVMVLHDLNLASEYCHRIILLNEGKIFKMGNPYEVLTYQNIESVYKTVVLVDKNPISHKPYVFLVPK